MVDTVIVFKALADQSRRMLLDRLHAKNRQTLTELCAGLDMTRQAVAQHLTVLEAAHLVATTWRGREKLHFVNPVPLQRSTTGGSASSSDRGCGPCAICSAAWRPEVPDSRFVYEIYIAAAADTVCKALLDGEFTRQYWKCENVFDWTPGSPWEHRRADNGSVSILGDVLEASPRNWMTDGCRDERAASSVPKSASAVTRIRPSTAARSKIASSSASCNPIERTWIAS